jgi:hypothetical protein
MSYWVDLTVVEPAFSFGKDHPVGPYERSLPPAAVRFRSLDDSDPYAN